jgi:hypothetical protein
VVVWATIDRVPLFQPQRILARLAPPPPAAVRLPTPLELGQSGLIESQVAMARFNQVQVERYTLDYLIDDPDAYWEFITAAPPPHIATVLRNSPPEELTQVRQEVFALLETFRSYGAIRLPCEAIYVTARR